MLMLGGGLIWGSPAPAQTRASGLKLAVKGKKLVALDKKQVRISSIVISSTLERIAYETTSGHAVIDGKRFGPYELLSPFTFSGDGSICAYLGLPKNSKSPQYFVEGNPVDRGFLPKRFLTGYDPTGIAAVESSGSAERIVIGSLVSGWEQKFERIEISPDGAGFAYFSTEGETKGSPKQFFGMSDGTRAPRISERAIYPAPRGKNFLTMYAEETPQNLDEQLVSRLRWKGKLFTVPGVFQGRPVFSEDGEHFAIRVETVVMKNNSNRSLHRYCVDGVLVKTVDSQTGFAFAPGSDDWVLCGVRDGEMILQRGLALGMPFDSIDWLSNAPREAYRSVNFAGNRLLLLFQNRNSQPVFVLQDFGRIDTGTGMIAPGSISISPGGRYVTFATDSVGGSKQHVIDLTAPERRGMLDYGPYTVDNPNVNRALWSSPNSFRLIVERGNALHRIDVTL